MKSVMKSRKGQTMVEYIIIVSLVAIALIGVIVYFTRGLGKTYAGATSVLNEEEGSNAKSAAENISTDSIRKMGNQN